MFLKKTTILLIFFTISSLIAQTDNDYDNIIQKIKSVYMEVNETDYSYVNNVNSFGQFNDIDYSDISQSDFSDHLNRVYSLAKVYVNSPDDDVREKYFNAMEYFFNNYSTLNYSDDNWYFYIGYTRLISYAHFLMHDYTYTYNNDLFRKIDDYIINIYNNRKIRQRHAADAVQIIEPLFSFYTLKRNSEKVNLLKYEFARQLQIAKPWEIFYEDKDNTIYRNSGIEADYSFTAHNVKIGEEWEVRRQIYNGGYGRSFVENSSKLFYFTDNTSLQFGDIKTTFSNFLVDGYQWTFYNKIMDNGVIGRINTDNGIRFVNNSFNLYSQTNPPRSSEIDKILDRVENGESDTNYLEGNKYFWRSDMMIHRRKDYYFSVKMTSDRTVAPETALDEYSTTNYYAGAGVTYLIKKGEEYTNGYSQKFNKRKFSGTTVEQDSRVLDIGSNNWGKGGENGNSFAGGITNGDIGACGMIWQKRGVTAHKSWFMFDEEIVALGSGIEGNNQTNQDIVTTINQSTKYEDIIYNLPSSNNNQIVQGRLSFETTNTPKYIFHDNVGYFPLSNNAIEINTIYKSPLYIVTTELFSIGINHGANPTDGSYSYLIKPNITIDEISNFINPVTILENSSSLQAVYHSESDIVQAVFFEKGELSIPNWNTTIEVNEKSLLMISRSIVDNEYNYTITVSNPEGENSSPRYKEIIFKRPYTRLKLINNDMENDISMVSVDRHESTLSFDAWDSRWGGQSSRQKTFKRECSVVAASSNDGNLPYNTRDNSLFSRWSAYGDGQYIQYYVCDGDETIDYIDVAFYLGDQRTSTFDISLGEDPYTWRKVLVNKTSSGNTLEKERFYLNQRESNFKYIRFTGHGNSQSLWNSITEFDWGDSLSSSKSESLKKETLNNNSPEAIVIKPNPTQNYINISSEELISKVTVTSITGNIILQHNDLNTKNHEIDFSKYAKGIYFVNIFNSNGDLSSKKILKE